MRAASVPVVLSSIVLSGWLGTAAAQDAGARPPQSSNPTGEQAPGSENLPPGVIPQPTPADPGLVTGIRPFVKAAWGGPRFSGMLDYTLSGYLYAGQGSNNQLAHDLNAQGTLAIVPQHFYLDGTAIYGRAIVNNALPSGAGTFFLNNNQANVARGTLSPWWTQDLGSIGTMTLRYTRGRVVYNRRGIPDQSSAVLTGIPNVTSNGVQFSLVSPKYGTWGWDFEYSDQRLSPDSGQGIDFAIAKAGISRQVNPSLRLLADAGKENQFLPDGTYHHLGAYFWDAGFEWATTRDEVKLLVGHRFYGRSGQFSWTHTAALLTATLSYVEQPTNLNQQLLGQNAGQIVVTPIGEQPLPSLVERRAYLMKRATASADYQMPRGTLNVTVYDESRRYFMLDNQREKVANASVSWLYDLGPFTTFTPTFGWERYRFLSQEVNYTRYLQLALVHQFNAGNFASLQLPTIPGTC